MAYDPLVVVYDACVLYPFHLRNLLVEVAVGRLVEPHWSNLIEEEWIGNLVADFPALSASRLQMTRDLMNAVLPAARVSGFEKHLSSINLPDTADRHVVAAAIESRASVIVTWNLRDFPTGVLVNLGLVAQTPDELFCRLAAGRPAEMVACAERSRLHLSRSTPSAQDFIAILERQGLARFASVLRTSSR